MEWFKHDSNASNDAKVKKLLIRYGVTGYAIYFHCLELICGDVNKTNITFELEHDSEIIADNLKINGTSDKSGIEIVEEIMRFIIEIGLFQTDKDRVFCYKLLKRLDTSMTSNVNFRHLITEAEEQNHDIVMTESRKIRREEIKHQRGEYKHVLLTDKQYDSLKDKVDDREYWIKTLDEGIELKGYSYKSHYLAILKWFKKDGAKPTSKPLQNDEIHVTVSDNPGIKELVRRTYAKRDATDRADTN